MEKMNCDIIRDLIPSYADGICSDATKRCVEEHISHCDACRQAAQFCMNSAFSGEKAEQKALDGFRKIRKIIDYQNLVCGLVLVFMIFLGVWQFFMNHNLSLLSYYILLGVSIAVSFVIGIGCQRNPQPGKSVYITCVIPFASDVYLACILLYFIQKLENGVIAFGLEAEECGYFFDRQLMISFFIQIAFFIYHFICIVRLQKNCSWMLCLDISGIFLALGYHLMLRRMDTLEVFGAVYARMTLATAGIGLLGCLANILVSKKIKNRQ